MPEGSVISNAPSKLSQRRRTPCDKRVDPKFALNMNHAERAQNAVPPIPTPQTARMMPSENTTACINPPLCPRKKDTVIGIMGNTQGVKMAASPMPNAVSAHKTRPSLAAGFSAAATSALPPILRIPRRNRQRRRSRSRGIHGHHKLRASSSRRQALLVVAGLIAHLRFQFHFTRGLFLQRRRKQEDNFAREGFGIQIEVGIELALGLGLITSFRPCYGCIPGQLVVGMGPPLGVVME